MRKILCIVGARPNFMKIAPIMDAMRSCKNIAAKLIHTGQHYDVEMNRKFFDELEIPKPDRDLEVGSGTHAVQTAEIMKRFEPVLDEEKPQAILVVGDVNSTIACALVAVKKSVQVIHVEAGLRSFDRTMPEEINRILTDQISDLLYITEANASEQLCKEGISEQKIHFVGNVMIDTLRRNQTKAPPVAQVLHAIGAGVFAQKPFCILTLHRPSNVDQKEILTRILHGIRHLSEEVPVIFPVHPRTKAKIQEFGLEHLIQSAQIVQTRPLGYLDMLSLNAAAQFVLTDSGGIQEETTALGVPCITLRENTERPITVEQGTNTIVGTDMAKMHRVIQEIRSHGGKSGRIPALWDGQAAIRIAKHLDAYFQ